MKDERLATRTKRLVDNGMLVRGGALFPFSCPPFLPFLRWAERAEVVFPSPSGPLIHPVYGLWHTYRGNADSLAGPSPRIKSLRELYG